jgi:hypothetical protein
MSEFIRVKLDWALMKVEEVEKRKENGRHSRKAVEAVMLLKKFRHDVLEKFCVKTPSKA